MSKEFYHNGQTYSRRSHVLETVMTNSFGDVLTLYNWCLENKQDPAKVPVGGYYSYVRSTTVKEKEMYDDRSARAKAAYTKRKRTIEQKELKTLKELANKYNKVIK